AYEAGLLQLDEQLAELALAVLCLRREQRDLRLVGQLGELVDDLPGGARADRPAALVAALLAGTSVEHAQVVVDLRDRADGRSRIASRGLLLDRDRRRQAADALVLRL